LAYTNTTRPKTPYFRGHQIIYIYARLRPMDTVSSYAVESIIRELVKQSVFSKVFFEYHDICIVPLVNVDGSVLGNSEGNLIS
jgi:murein tripeptide amidase MpaA